VVDESDQPAGPAPSTRVTLAELARDVALTTPGVVELDAGVGGRHATVGAGRRVPGITCAAAPGGGFDLGLRIVCSLEPLPAIADWLRQEIAIAAGRAGILVARIEIDIVDIVVPEAS
jgi:hypothetical protein